MSEILNESQRKPGIVIFVAILNFFSCALWVFLSLLLVMFLILGNTASGYQQITSQIQQRLPNQTLPTAFTWNALFLVLLVGTLFFMLYHLFLGLGLLKGKGAAWYVQVVAAVLGLIMIPYGTIISIVILIFFFRSNVRNFFKV